MEIGTTLIGRVLSWIPAPWSGVRLGSEVEASLCTRDHIPIFVVGPGVPQRPPVPAHVDVLLKLWTPAQRTSVRVIEAKAAGQALVPDNFFVMTLEPGGAPEEETVEFQPPHGEELRAVAGDRVKIKLTPTRGWPKKVTVVLQAEDR